MDEKIIERCKTCEKQCMQEGLTDREAVELLSSQKRAHKITSINRDMCGESIEKLPRNLKGSRICRKCIEQIESTEIWLDGLTQLSRSYQGQIQKSRQKKLVSSCCRVLSRRYQVAVEKTKARFSKGGKTHKMKAIRQLLKQASKQHVKH